MGKYLHQKHETAESMLKERVMADVEDKDKLLKCNDQEEAQRRRDHMKSQHTQFSASGVGLGLLKQFLGNKFPENEEYLKQLSSKAYSMVTARSKEEDLRLDLMDKLSYEQLSFENQYVQPAQGEESSPEFAIRRMFMQKQLEKEAEEAEEKKAQEAEGEETDDDDDDDSDEGGNKRANCKKTTFYKYI